MIKIDKYTIIGTNITKFAAYEPTTFDRNQGYLHSTITHSLDTVCYGQIGTRRPTTPLPTSPEDRYTAVMAHYNAQYEEAYALIIAQYPEATNGLRDMGEIEICTA